MLTLKVVQEVERLLLDGKLSQRKIAARLGVSRGSVSAIASGRRAIYGKSESEERPPATGTWIASRGAGTERCPRCGFRVYMPCLVCRTRKYRELLRRRAARGGSAGMPRAG